MTQTVKFGKVRAAQDPDRIDGEPGRDGIGIYTGLNIPGRAFRGVHYTDPTGMHKRTKHTHGACH